MATTPEGKVKALVKKRLKQEFGDNCYFFMPVQTGYGSPTLDFLICIHGIAVYIETKAPGKHPTPLQKTTIQTMIAAGGLVFVIDDTPSLDACIKAVKRKHNETTKSKRPA